MPGPKAELLELLGEPREVLDQLTDAEAEALHRLILRARREQQACLSAAIDSALQVLPRLIRIPARSILLGK